AEAGARARAGRTGRARTRARSRGRRADARARARARARDGGRGGALMTEISAGQVKELRERTGAGMMDCKRALVETAGDIEAAVKAIREKGLAQAAKKAGRETTEGKVVYDLTEETVAAMVAVGCETEPVSNNHEFMVFAQRVLDTVERHGPDAAQEL